MELRVTTTLTVYTDLFGGNHADALAALGAMGNRVNAKNVIPLAKARR